MEGFSVSGRPAVLWSHPLPRGVVSTCSGEGGHGAPRGSCTKQDQAAEPDFPKPVQVTQGICLTDTAFWVPRLTWLSLQEQEPGVRVFIRFLTVFR